MSHPHPKIVLLTGCSSGFGLLTAAHLAFRGHQVVATMRDLEKRHALVNELNRRGISNTVDILRLDVTDKSSIREAIQKIAAKHGYLDVLVNNAGYGIGGSFEDLTDEEIRAQMDVNFFGAQNVTREVIPLMRPRRQGRIINVSSVAGFYGSPCFGAYNASKWALEGFSESLRYELKFFGIDVLLVEPGTYKTKIFFENARAAKNAVNPQSPYCKISQHLKNRVYDYLKICRKDPEDVGRLIGKLILAKKPPFRSSPDMEARMLYRFRKILPFRIFSGIMRKILFQGLKT